MQSQVVLTKDTLQTVNLVYDDIILTHDNQFALAKMWYGENVNSMHSVFYQTGVLQISHYDAKTGDFTLELNQNDKLLLDEIDKLSIKYIKCSNLIHRLSLSQKEVKYRTIVNDTKNSNGEPIKSIKVRNTLNTKYYSNGVKKSKQFNEVMPNLFNGSNVKIIIEFDGVTVDIKKNLLVTNLILHQFKLQKIVPKRFELTEYSFIDSDADDDEVFISNSAITSDLTNLKQNTNVQQSEKNSDNESENESKKNSDKNGKKNKENPLEEFNESDNEMSENNSDIDHDEIEDEEDEENDINDVNDVDDNTSEGNSFEEESSDIDVDEFVNNINNKQNTKQQTKSQQTTKQSKAELERLKKIEQLEELKRIEELQKQKELEAQKNIKNSDNENSQTPQKAKRGRKPSKK